jgi:hypothetical protein
VDLTSCRAACISIAALTAVFACTSGSHDHKRESGRDTPVSGAVKVSAVKVSIDAMTIQTGPVGHGRWKSEGTYVMVDAHNTGERDLMVTLGGVLQRDGGQEVSRLRPQSLRIPAGGVRMFALVDMENKAQPEATAARIDVKGAFVPDYPPPVVVSHGRVDMDEGRAVVQGYVENTAEREVAVVVIAGFYDGSGKPVSRPSTRYIIDGGQRRGAMFVGPKGSSRAYLFVGEYAY